MRAKSLVLFSWFFACPAFSSDTVVGCGVLDPEVHDGFKMVVYQHIADLGGGVLQQQAKVQWINSNGTLYATTVDDGVVATDLNDYLEPRAGPKFANGGNGSTQATYIVYSRLNLVTGQGSRRTIGLIRYNANATGCAYPTGAGQSSPKPCLTSLKSIPDSQHQPPATTVRVIAYGTEDEVYDRPAMVVYHYQDASTQPATHKLYWSEIGPWFQNSGTETIGIATAEQGQWGRLHRYYSPTQVELRVTTVQGEKVELVRVADKSVKVVAQGGQWFNPFLFRDPSPPAKNMIVLRADIPGPPARSDIVVYKEDTPGGTWSVYKTITAADLRDPNNSSQNESTLGRPFLLSPEAFSPDGLQIYLLFSSASIENALYAADGNIWVVSLNDPVNHQLRVNDRPAPPNDVRNRIEGEIYLGNPGSPTVYYSQLWTPNDPQGLGGCVQQDPTIDVSHYAMRMVPVQLP